MSFRKQPIAYLALFIALGGTAYAATALPAGSVGTRQLKNGVVTDVKVRQRSLRSNVFAPGTLPRGLHTTVQSAGVGPSADGGSSPGTPYPVNLTCPVGQRAVGGGWDFSHSGGWEVTVDRPYANDEGWTVSFTPNQDFSGIPFAYAVCAT